MGKTPTRLKGNQTCFDVICMELWAMLRNIPLSQSICIYANINKVTRCRFNESIN